MKTSPLQLDWVAYPEASYEALTSFDGDESAPVDVDVDARVHFNAAGKHVAYVEISSREEAAGAYKFRVTALAQFKFDLEIARAAYKPKTAIALPPVIAVNVARVLYSSAREQLAMMTSRGPFRSVVLRSVLLEPTDVTIASPGAEPEEILAKVFGATAEDLKVVEQSAASSKTKKRQKAQASN